ncbi:ABC transporter permease [Luteimonas sp. e5]
MKFRLAFSLASRDIQSRYRGSAFGLVWSVFQPIIMLLMYTVFFTQVFGARWRPEDEGMGTYAVALFVGIVIHGFVAEALTRGGAVILSNPNYVKKLAFPIEIMPWAVAMAALFTGIIGIVISICAWLLIGQEFSSVAWQWPLLLFPILLFTAATAFMCAALNVYVRDFGHVTSVLVTVLLFTSPVFFRSDQIDGWFRNVIELNPLTFLIEQSRNTLLFGEGLDIGRYGGFVAGTVVFYAGAVWFFKRVSPGFADVL